MYRQLLYSAGGGILSNMHKAEQAECVTLAIGLGGTGIDCLRNLKRQVYEMVKPDNPDNLNPIYSHIKFLAVDSDRSSMRDDGMVNPLDEGMEFFDISVQNTPAMHAFLKKAVEGLEFRWFDKDMPPINALNQDYLTTYGIRQIGRLFLMIKSDAFVQRVASLIRDAKRDLPEGVDINVHIFSGLGGGTGSGIFLDVCYLVQFALDEVGEEWHAITSGYFFLPDVNLSLPQISVSESISSYIKANGYAAMKELDYCMGLYTNGGYWEQEYRGFRRGPVNAPPVKICYLISASDFYGHALANGYENAMNAVGEHVMQFLVNSDFSMTALYSDFYNTINTIPKKYGANYQYFALGVSSAAVPIKEISTYLGSKLFEAFSDFRAKYPADEEIAQFAKENGLDVHGLLKLVMNKTSFDMTIVALQERDLRGSLNESDLYLPNELILPDGIMMLFHYQRDRMAAQVELNIEGLTQDWSRDRIIENKWNISRVWKVYSALEQVISDPDKGPFYAATVLYGSGRKNLVDILQEDLEMIQRELMKTNLDLPLRLDAAKKARSAYLHPGFLQNRQRLFDTFIAATTDYFELTARILVLEKMQGMILKIMEQFKDLYRIHFEPFLRVYNQLLETFHENYQVMTDGVGFRVPEDTFIMDIQKLDDHMKELLDSAVENLNFAHEAYLFNYRLFNAYDVWEANDERKIAKFVSEYINDVFFEYTQNTITKYLEMRFDTDNRDMLIDRTYREVFRPLNEMAAPLFWSSPLVNQYIRDLGYISVPKRAAVINGAADKLMNENYYRRLIKSTFGEYNSRIRILRYLCGFPMYGYKGTYSYREDYRRDAGVVGRHIYEGTKSDPRDWRNLPDLIPFSVEQGTPEVEEE